MKEAETAAAQQAQMGAMQASMLEMMKQQQALFQKMMEK